LAYCIKGGNREDAEEFLGLYLDALDEELVELHTYIRTHMLASTGGAEKLEEGAQQAGGQTKVGKREHTVRQFFLLLCTELDVADVCMDTNRQVQSIRPSLAYSVESPV
jgi:hypothetical protein